MRLAFVLPLVAASLLACNTTISVKNYKVECAVDADCVGVQAGDVCNGNCFCNNGAVSNAEAARFAKDRTTMLSACPRSPLPFGTAKPAVCRLDCRNVSAVCTAGTCAIKVEPAQFIATYSNDCTTDDECAPVYEGNLCQDSCECANAAVNKGSLEKYTTDHDATVKTCPSERQACAHECGIVAPRAACVNRKCALQ